jgi:hypothetical protein
LLKEVTLPAAHLGSFLNFAQLASSHGEIQNRAQITCTQSVFSERSCFSSYLNQQTNISSENKDKPQNVCTWFHFIDNVDWESLLMQSWKNQIQPKNI